MSDYQIPLFKSVHEIFHGIIPAPAGKIGLSRFRSQRLRNKSPVPTNDYGEHFEHENQADSSNEEGAAKRLHQIMPLPPPPGGAPEKRARHHKGAAHHENKRGASPRDHDRDRHDSDSPK